MSTLRTIVPHLKPVVARLAVIHESAHYIAVAKPPFTICQDELDNPASLSNVLRETHPRFFESKQHPFHPPKGVHRLDAPVTGCVLYGTSVYGTRQLAKNFRKRKVEKGYLALLTKIPGKHSVLDDADTGTIETEGRTTEWTVLARLSGRGMRCDTIYVCWLRPHEGRNHQLRIHAAENLNAPILFDHRYPIPIPDPYAVSSDSSGVVEREDAYERVKGEGIALHCAWMAFPLGLERQCVSCAPPDGGIWESLARLHRIHWPHLILLATTPPTPTLHDS